MFEIPISPEKGPAIIGHRGASARARDNTVAAFRLAGAEGADGVELDVRRTADGAVVVIHDPGIADVGDVHDLTYAQLKAGAPWLPTLDQAMEACAGMWVNIEIKNTPTEDGFDEERRLVPQIIDWVRANGEAERVIISSFDPGSVALVRQEAPELATGLLVSPAMAAADGIALTVEGDHQAVNLHDSHLRPRAAPVVARAAEHDLTVVVWTVDDPDRIRTLADAGVAGIITNDPAGAIAALRPTA